MKEEKTKTSILKKVQADRRRLEQNLVGLAAEQMIQPGVVKEWSVKDVLAHLAEWEAMCLRWVDATRRGETPAVPAPDVTFKDLAPLNQRIFDQFKDYPLDKVLEMFHSVHRQFITLMESMPDNEMLNPGPFPWTGNSPLYNWFAAYAAHDRWGKTKIRAWRKTLS